MSLLNKAPVNFNKPVNHALIVDGVFGVIYILITFAVKEPIKAAGACVARVGFHYRISVNRTAMEGIVIVNAAVRVGDCRRKLD